MHYSQSRGLFAGVVGFWLLLMLGTGCTRSDDTPDAATERATTEDEPIMVVVAEDEHGRTVRHPCGETVIPLHPRRIAAFGIALDDLVTIGVEPQMVGIRWTKDVCNYLKDACQNAERIGSVGYSVNIIYEQLWRAHPDLILTGSAQQYPAMSRIAPTLVTARGLADVEDYSPRVRALGEALGIAAQANAALDAHLQRLAEAGETLRRRLHGRSIALLHMHARQVRLMTSMPFIRETLGLTPAFMMDQPDDRPLDMLVTAETLGRLRADVLVVGLDEQSIGARKTLEELLDNPLIQFIPAVQTGHILEVEIFPWIFRSAPAAERVIADLLAAFPAEPTLAPSQTAAR